ncbi:hypothetical protein V1264_014458 [Littorina saxatilis]|uniref:Transposase n=1 Tax=Littorina saxatilis TaxID=31220 RepID=A0AAN9BRV6_9CAEN
MVQRRSLPDVDKGRALAWLQRGATYRAVAHRLGVSPSVVWRLQERWRATGRVQDRPRSGRPKKTDARADRYIVRQALTSRTITAERIRGQLRVATNIQVSTQTIRNRLHNVRLRSRVPAKKPKLTPVHKRARRDWSARHSRWTRHQWATVLFSDESRFNLMHPDKRLSVWRREGERFNQDCVQEVLAYGGGSVMVWGGFSANHKTPLYHIQGNLTGARYRDEILGPIVIPFLQQLGPQATLQDDNATPHRARVVGAFLQQQGVHRMEWPACSPDLNPIENVWDHLDRQLRDNHPPPNTLQNLLAYLQHEWQNLDQQLLRRHVQSMRRRCNECLARRGAHTHY